MEDIKVYLNKWREMPCLWITRVKVVKISFLPKYMYRFNAFPSKFQ